MDFEFVKQHKWAIAGGIAASVGILYFVYRAQTAGDVAVQNAPGMDPVAAGLAAQSAQLQAQTGIAQLQAQSGIEIAKISADAQQNLSEVNAGVELSRIAAGRDTAYASIAGQIEQSHDILYSREAEISAGLDMLRSNNETSLGIANVIANQQIAIANTNASVQKNMIDSQEHISYYHDLADVMKTQATAKASQKSPLESIIGGVVGIAGALL